MLAENACFPLMIKNARRYDGTVFKPCAGRIAFQDVGKRRRRRIKAGVDLVDEPEFPCASLQLPDAERDENRKGQHRETRQHR